MNTFNFYQEWTATTAIYPEERAMDYLIHGLTSEAGEVAGKWKKYIRDEEETIDSVRALAIAKELGDCVWYIARLADEIGWTFQDIIDLNIVKLEERKEREVIGGSGDNR